MTEPMAHFTPFASADEFAQHVTCLPLEESDSLRHEFGNAFVDSTRPDYERLIRTRQRFSDGDFYTGYLWDFFKHPHIASERAVWNRIDDAPGEVYVMWDLHSSERILVPGYWQFPRHAVLRCDPPDVRRGAGFLPEDIYVFDGSFSWCACLTHEFRTEDETRVGVIALSDGPRSVKE
jgi:hypothetical protein